MIDLKLVRDDPDLVRASQRTRGADPGLVDALLAADDARRAVVARADSLRAEAKSISKDIGRAAPEDRPAVQARARQLKDDVRAIEADETAADKTLREAQFAIANIVEDGVPEGGEDDFVTLETVGTPPSVENPRDHLEIGAGLKAIDTERGAKVSGARFYFLTGVGAQLEFALVNLAMQQATEAGFTQIIAPALVKPEVMQGTGFLGAHADEIYHLERDNLYLVGTSEVALAGLHADQILDADELPLRYCAFSTCFRREAGAAGRDTRGIFRVHQFDKVEMFCFVAPEDSVAWHDRLLSIEEEILSALELPYRVVNIAVDDLGASAAKKYDCEAWLPGQGAYRELTSTSNTTDFQARRLDVRYRPADGGRPRHVHTLNGTAVAVGRTIVALLENGQRDDGSIALPAALSAYGVPAELPAAG